MTCVDATHSTNMHMIFFGSLYILCWVIQNRLKSGDLLLRDSQCGFRPGRGCVDKVFSLRILMEKAREFHTPLYLCYVDLTKAYDRHALWSVLERRYISLSCQTSPYS